MKLQGVPDGLLSWTRRRVNDLDQDTRNIVLDAAEARGLRIAETVIARFHEAIEAGHGERDLAAVCQAARVDHIG